MSTVIILFRVVEETQELKSPVLPVKLCPPLWFMLSRQTKTELLRDLIPGEMGFCEEDGKLYFRSRETKLLYSSQMEPTI
jgi:hypothetical protein